MREALRPLTLAISRPVLLGTKLEMSFAREHKPSRSLESENHKQLHFLIEIVLVGNTSFLSSEKLVF